MTDIKAQLNKYIQGISLLITCFLSTQIMRFKAFCYGIELGRDIEFYGQTTFHRAINSKIQIADRCKFRSLKDSNLIGINHRTIISTLKPGSAIVIGKGCGFSGTTIGCEDKIIFGDNVRCGANTLITDTDWHTDDIRAGKAQPVFIEDNVWLGVNVVVLKGVRIGKNTLIGANSLVTKNIPDNVIAAGNPCRVIRAL